MPGIIHSLLTGMMLFAAPGFNSLQAKGLDDLNPGVDKNPAVPDPDSAFAKGGGAAQEAPMEKSALSKSLENKLYIASGAGLSTLDGSKGDWSTRGSGDFSIGYRAMDNLMGRFSLNGTFRYHPFDVVVSSDTRSSRGIVEIYYFGAEGIMALGGGLEVVGTGELGLVSVSLKSVDGYEEDPSLEDGSAILTIGGGADMNIIEGKVKAGPRMYIGAGSFQAITVGGVLKFIF